MYQQAQIHGACTIKMEHFLLSATSFGKKKKIKSYELNVPYKLNVFIKGHDTI